MHIYIGVYPDYFSPKLHIFVYLMILFIVNKMLKNL